MKLKKIASLMLAGIMAVSMLAGCNGEPAPDPDDNGDGGVTVTGHSVDMGEALKDLDCIKDKDYITFADNAADQAALQKAVDSVEASWLEDKAEMNGAVCLDSAASNASDTTKRVATIFADGAKFTDPSKDTKANDLAMTWYAGYDKGNTKLMNVAAKDGTIYVVNGDVTTEQAVLMVADKVEDILEANTNALPKTNKGADDNNDTSWKYGYTISVSVVDKALQSNYTGAANSVHFVAVTVSRTATAG